MGTRATKERKRRRRETGEHFVHPEKTPTPVNERSSIFGAVPGAVGTRYEGRMRPRSEKYIERKTKDRAGDYHNKV